MYEHSWLFYVVAYLPSTDTGPFTSPAADLQIPLREGSHARVEHLGFDRGVRGVKGVEEDAEVHLVDLLEKVAHAVLGLAVVEEHEAHVARRHERRDGELAESVHGL